MKKVLFVFGTRPKAIKMCPLVLACKNSSQLQTVVCVTGQHRQMLEQVLNTFSVTPEYDLHIMKERQTLFDVTTGVLEGVKTVLEKERPDIVLVHGDTSSTFAAALASFYMQIPIGHVEAGLRTYHLYSPYPEEMNRQCVGAMATYHFAPTLQAKENLIREGKDPKSIFITGNTAIDALHYTVRSNYQHPILDWCGNNRLIVLTAHRRENLGKPMERMFHLYNT